MKDGFVRAAAASPMIKTADCNFNGEQIISLVKEAAEKDVSVIVFPELCITGSTCGDLFLHRSLLDSAMGALLKIAEETKELDIFVLVGLPVSCNGKLYNCAAAVKDGKVMGLVPKLYIDSEQSRWFTGGEDVFAHISEAGAEMGQIMFEDKAHGLVIAAEVGNDITAVSPMSDSFAQQGAVLVCTLAASSEAVGRKEARRQLLKSRSSKLICGYVYANAGLGESTQDNVFSGHSLICENGRILAESRLFETGMICTEIDIERIDNERRRNSIFKCGDGRDTDSIAVSFKEKQLELTRKYELNPFVPSDKNELASRCGEILTMQAVGLMSRLKHINCKKAVLGLSGGLDSTLALIVTVHAFDMLGLDRDGIIAVTMPCFGTTSRTKNNACELAKAYGTQLREVNIAVSVRQHFSDIGHSEDVRDVTYENSQARERTQVLMDIANKENSIVIGTGDLSELALGWATYNGDHMSMYGVNASVPKTLIRHVVAYEAGNTSDEALAAVLRDVLDTPVSPELLPPSENGEIAQKTEDIVGPYELHDFFLYYFVRCAFSPEKILRLAKYAFKGSYDDEVIEKWLGIFMRRFFTQQFKRSCLPDGPAVGSVTLSPRGGFVMPSDASQTAFKL
ncbi:MAG: NAD(+) synthase [Oscillospiraceae bacterium]|nr:NAD(+) synthase [Oscillospiraceae bacterium]